MEVFHNSFAASNHYHQYTSRDEYSGNMMRYGDHFEALDPALMLHDQPTAMHRFLREPDPRPLFTTGHSPTSGWHAMQNFPEVITEGFGAYDSTAYPSYRGGSPLCSGMAPSYISSSPSDRRDTPASSPDMDNDPYPSLHHSTDHMVHPYGGSFCQGPFAEQQGVKPHDVFKPSVDYVDKPELDDDASSYGLYTFVPAHDGYHPMPDEGNDVTESGNDDRGVHRDFKPRDEQAPPASPNIRRRRASANRPPTSPETSSRVSKRTQAQRRASSSNVTSKQNTANRPPGRPFPCPLACYGCQSTFSSKNEWKRHVKTQHLRVGFWRCDECPGRERRPNDFNRKDLYIQHVRRMHSTDCGHPETKSGAKASKNMDDETLNASALRCYQSSRSPPKTSGCMFCHDKFDSWDNRMEHIGRHLEDAKKEKKPLVDVEQWRTDEALESWLLKEGIVELQGESLVLAESKT